MTNINTTNTSKNAVEIRAELQKNGTTIEYIVVNGQKLGILGSTGEQDKQNAIRTIQTALDASNGNIYEMMSKLSTIATIEEKNIDPDEMVEVCGQEIMISYTQAKAYTMDGEEIANCTDLNNLPNEAVKALLVARAEVVIVERANDNDCDEYDEDDEW